MRYTEYHAGVPVIKDKRFLKDAMQKLAKYEDAEEEILSSEKMIDSLIDFCSDKKDCTGCMFIYNDCSFPDMSYTDLETAYKAMLEAINKR